MQKSEIEERLERIETKLSFAEDLLEELNNLAFRQQAQIDRLDAQIRQIQERSEHSSGAHARDPRDDIPPHY
ncbi:SlyX family protein [Orrella marina]|uniref:SlyX protein n=1 Tax=Orrella marina TaxID=2163011 RepID=A0A2R4XKM9_9BURK|nr:SlyX family protein [Orrella marina]AWB34340.1 SlyX protein [Orrella marina]